VISETQNQAEIACLSSPLALLLAAEIIVASRPWDKAVTTLHIQGVPLSMAFHAYDPHVAIANEADIIRSVLKIRVLVL
jgi:hypothetical protein